MKRMMVIVLFFFCNKPIAQDIAETEKLFISRSIACTPVKDQNLSSTCWSFAGNSFIESEVLRNKGKHTDLSEMFIARYAYLNKVQQYLLHKGGIFFTPGGQFHDILKVIKEYGIVPEAAYSGKVNGQLQHDHSKLDTVMKYYVADLLAKHTTKLSQAQLSFINSTLDKYLGKVPTSFFFEGKRYTPKTFAAEVLNFDPDEYIEITSYTHHPFYKKFILEDRYNWSQDSYYNVPLDDFMTITDSAIHNNFSVCWDGDVTEDGFRFDNGIAKLPEKVSNYQAERQKTYEDKSSKLDHMMHITGMAKDKNNTTWYQVKNSWGSANTLGGYMLMKEDYFKIKTIAIIVNKKAVPPAILQKLKF